MFSILPRYVFASIAVLAMVLGLWAGPAAAQPALPPAEASGSSASPLSVEINYFIGGAHPGYILLEWETASEVHIQAFRIRRGTTPNPNQASILNPPGVVQAHLGSTIGYYYSWQDSYNLTPGVTYYYWLEDQNEFGNWNLNTTPTLVPIVPYCSRYDVDCNLAVNTTDITLVANAWNCDVFAACYSSRYDLDGSNIIGVRDVMLVAAHWGCQWANACYW